MKTIICTIGNRDLQFYNKENIMADLKKYLSINNDDNNYFIINKSNANLYELTKNIFENYNTYENFIKFPLIEKAINNCIQNNFKLVLIPTNQNPPDRQDTFYIACIAQKYFNDKGYTTIIENIDFNPTDFDRLFSFFVKIFDDYADEEIYCANSGGTPQMKTASEFAGLFKNITYISVNARNNEVLSNFKKQEKVVLKHTIEKMLKVYAYEGIALLPVINENIKKLCEIAIARLSLDFKTAKNIADTLNETINKSLLEILRNQKADIDITRQMYLSAKIKFVQKSYGDYLWRLFSIHDNIFIPYVEKFFNSKIKYCEEDNHADWCKLLNSNPELLEYIKTCKVGSKNEPLKYEVPGKYVYREILNFAVSKNHESISREEYDKLEKIHISIDRLGKIRNAIAHNLKGVSIKDIEKSLKKNKITLDDFNALLAEYFKISNDDYCEFNLINNEILKRLY